jgi:hypothetical protein
MCISRATFRRVQAADRPEITQLQVPACGAGDEKRHGRSWVETGRYAVVVGSAAKGADRPLRVSAVGSRPRRLRRGRGGGIAGENP